MYDYFKHFVSAVKEKITNILINHYCNINSRDFCRNTPLHDAARTSSPKLVKLLIENGAEVNVRTRVGYTPLHLAAKYSSIECTNLLLEHGADVNSSDMDGNTPLDYATNLEIRQILSEYHKLNPGKEECAPLMPENPN